MFILSSQLLQHTLNYIPSSWRWRKYISPKRLCKPVLYCVRTHKRPPPSSAVFPFKLIRIYHNDQQIIQIHIHCQFIYLFIYGCLSNTAVGSLEYRIVTSNNYVINPLKSTGYVTHQQFNIQQLYALPSLYLCVLYLSEDKQRLVPLTA